MRQADDGNEQFDVLDCTGRRTGEVIPRAAAHRTGTWHGAFHCLLFFRREGKISVLFQKRAQGKQIAPGFFDVTAGGHYASGETAAEAGPREIGEELGLRVRFEQLVPLGKRIFIHCFTPGVREFEFQDVFLLPLDGMPRELALQGEEVDGLLEMDLELGIELFDGQRRTVPAVLYPSSGGSVQREVTAAEFVPCLDSYYLRLLVLARRYADGERGALAV
jgi:isopentenyldiphosphate isomerase